MPRRVNDNPTSPTMPRLDQPMPMMNAALPFCRHALSFAGWVATMGALAVSQAQAQAQAPSVPATPVPAPAAAASAPRPASAASAPTSAPVAAPAQRIEIQGRTNDANERRESTAAKIVIGREEIERYGDSNTSEVLKRLPGVTVGGAPGRGGAPRMRGLGAGFTQILLNGERLPPGFSIDSITPEQIERIEVLRAPTAETGARAIAGTINIITREGFKKKLNDLKLGFQWERGRVSPGLFWTRNDSVDEWLIYTGAVGLFVRDTLNPGHRQTTVTERDTGTVVEDYLDETSASARSKGINLNARLQFRLGQGHSLVLTPMVIYNHSDTRTTALRTPPGSSSADPEYASSLSDTSGQFRMARLNTQYNRNFEGGLRADVRLNTGVHGWQGHTFTESFDANQAPLRTVDNRTDFTDTNVSFNAKLTKLFVENHNIVTGLELENNRRDETRTRVETLASGASVPSVGDFGDNVKAQSRRSAWFVQDEWNISPQWAAHAGLRWEGINTRGSGEGGVQVTNRSSVTTPLVHAVYKFDPKSRDQARVSLTRSYRVPTLQQLISKPYVAPINTPTTPDRDGNPDLKPELATGVDLALERYLADGGVLSASVFHRRIKNVIRNRIEQDPASLRYESRPLNISDATTSGLELEAKFRLDQAITDAPRIDLRLNGSLFHSQVDDVPGPNNRLEQQARGTFNLGADYRFRGTPLALGGNLNYTPAVTTRLSDTQTFRESAKLVGDAYATWTFNPNLLLRVSASNFTARTYETYSQIDFTQAGDPYTQSLLNRDRTALNLNVRLEIKL